MEWIATRPSRLRGYVSQFIRTSHIRGYVSSLNYLYLYERMSLFPDSLQRFSRCLAAFWVSLRKIFLHEAFFLQGRSYKLPSIRQGPRITAILTSKAHLEREGLVKNTEQRSTVINGIIISYTLSCQPRWLPPALGSWKFYAIFAELPTIKAWVHGCGHPSLLKA